MMNRSVVRNRVGSGLRALAVACLIAGSAQVADAQVSMAPAGVSTVYMPPETLYKKANENFNNGRYFLAIDQIERAVTLVPDSAKYLAYYGYLHFYIGDPIKGGELLDSSLRRFPTSPYPLLYSAPLHYQSGNLLAATLCLEEAEKFATTDSFKADILETRANYRLAAKEFAFAKLEAGKAQKYRGRATLSALTVLGAAEEEQMNYSKADSIYQVAAEKFPKSAYPYDRLGLMYQDLKQYQKSVDFLNKSIARDSMAAFAYNNRGYSHLQLKNYDAAKKDIEMSLLLNSGNSYAHRNLGLYYQAVGKKQQACDCWDDALALDYTARYGKEVEEWKKNYNCKPRPLPKSMQPARPTTPKPGTRPAPRRNNRR